MADIYTPDQDAFIREQDGKLTDTEIAAALGRTPKGIENRRLRLRQLARSVELRKAQPEIAIKPGRTESHVNTNCLFTDNALVISDLHVPHHNADFLNKLLDLSLAWDITHCLVNGDLFDHAQFKTHPGRASDSSLEEEIACARDVVKSLSTVFQEVVIDFGNHEERLILRNLNSALSVKSWSRLFVEDENVRVIDYPYAFIYGKRKYVAGHPGKYSKDPGKVAANIGKEKFPDHSVITAHTHHVGMRQRRNSCGLFWDIDQGCCARVETFEWVAKSGEFGDIPHMNVGAVVIKDSHPFLITPESPIAAMQRMFEAVA